MVDELFARNPFPGLRAFNTNEVDLFFGRRQQIEELADRLGEVNFVAVAGASGCGKSSLVRAGLLSELARRSIAGSETAWRTVVMRPGSQPIANLAEQLSPVLGLGSGEESRSGTLYGQLRLGALGLVEAVRIARFDPHVRVLVVVDQFEEIFRFKRMTDADEASAFVKLLLNAARNPESPVSVVITLRSETLGYCADFRDLPETINRGQYLVPKLTREQRKEAIIGPIELRGFQIAPRLVQRLLNDISDDFDDLPVMQHALARTWNKWASACQGSRPIDLEDYEAVGTTKQALSNHADEAFHSLPKLELVIEKVFRALTESVEGIEVRRPLGMNLLCKVVGADQTQVEQVVERFRRYDTAFLMPGQDTPLASNPVIDISHESLIRQWQRLRHWTQVEGYSRAMLLRLIEAARLYQTNQGSLWLGRDLERALEWQQSTKPTPAWVGLYANGDGVAAWESVKSFLDASVVENRRDRRRRKLQIGGRLFTLAAVIVSVITAVVLFNQRAKTKSRELANMALTQIGRDPVRSAHFASASVRLDPDNPLGLYALRQSLATLEVAHIEKILPKFDAPVADVRYTRDGSRLVTAGGKMVKVFDTKNGFEKVGEPIARDQPVLKVWLVANNKILVTQTEGGLAQIQRLDGSPAYQITCEGEKNSVYTISVSPDERHVALGCFNGDVLIWDATESPARPKYAYTHKVKDDVTITALAFSGDGKYLASGDVDGVVNVWKLGYPTAWIEKSGPGSKDLPIRHDKAIRDIGFYQDDPNLLVTAADDKRAIVWRLDLEHRRLDRDEKNKPTIWPLPHDRPVIAAKFTAALGDMYPVFTVSGKIAQRWVNGIRDEKQARMHDDWINAANASSDGQMLITASDDGTARIWSTQSGAPIAVLRGHNGGVNHAVFSHDGNQAVTASADGYVRVWRLRPPRLLSFSTHWALGAAFEPHGTRIAIGEEDGRGNIVDLNDSVSGLVPFRHDVVCQCDEEVVLPSWSRDRKFLLGIKYATGIRWSLNPVLWDVASRKERTPPWLTKLRTAVFNPETDELLTVNEKGQIAVWDMKSLDDVDPQAKLTFGFGFGEDREESFRWMAAMSPDGKWIGVLSGNNVELWNRDEPAAHPRKLVGHRASVKSLQFSRNSKQLLTASQDGTARIWSVDSLDAPQILTHTTAVFSASFDSKGERVVTGSPDGKINVWNAKTAERLASLRWHSEGVNSVEYSDDGKWILTASDDGTVKLGQCEACTLEIKALQERVAQFAQQLPKEDLDEIHRVTGETIRP